MLLENLNQLKYYCEQYNTLYVWGSGSFGEKAINYLKGQGITIGNVFDNNPAKVGELVQGIEVIAFNHEILERSSKSCIIICSSYYDEIEAQLKQLRISNYAILPNKLIYHMKFNNFYMININRFENMFNRLDEESKVTFKNILDYRRTGDSSLIKQSNYEQYFHPQVSPFEGDTIIDGGAFTGDTAIIFNQALNEKCVIHSFEPTFNNYSELKKMTEQYSNVFPNQLGLGEKCEELKVEYNEECPAGSKFTDDGVETVSIVSIDDYMSKQNVNRVDIIKLDVEGFELASLKGAKQTIKAYKPKLQVCLYHSDNDLIDIFEYLEEEFSDLGYNFYVGHHSDVIWETVLYAISEKR